MFEAINGMLLDMLAAAARKDYEDRRRHQAQGQAKAMAEGRYKGRPEILSAILALPACSQKVALELHSGHDGLQPRHSCEGCQAGRRASRLMPDRVRVIKNEAVPGCSSLEVRFPDDWPSQYSIGMTFRPAGSGRRRTIPRSRNSRLLDAGSTRGWLITRVRQTALPAQTV
jgi:hypothetical protein